jgi:hypothetical protein
LKFPKFTTNLDENFEEALNSRKNKVGFTSETGTATSETREKLEIISGDFFDGMLIKENALYKIHGSYPTMEKYSVITTNDYLEHYYVKDKLGGFLGSVFKNYIVIFIGCGMEEFEILQPVIESSKEHHALIGTYLSEANLLRIQKEYFRKAFGIHAHGYYLDFDGYSRLQQVIESWVEKINFELNGDFYQKTGEFNDIEL